MWQSRDIPLKYLESQLKLALDENEQLSILNQLNEMRQKRKYLDEHIESFVGFYRKKIFKLCV